MRGNDGTCVRILVSLFHLFIYLFIYLFIIIFLVFSVVYLGHGSGPKKDQEK